VQSHSVHDTPPIIGGDQRSFSLSPRWSDGCRPVLCRRKSGELSDGGGLGYAPVVTNGVPGGGAFSPDRDRRDRGDDFAVVALVCSAGGLDALTRVLEPLPADLPAAVLVLQHVSPEHPSTLAAVLDQRTDLRVAAAADGAPLVPGQVLVSPAGQHTLITADETIALIPSGSLPPYRPSADLLLTTLAVVAGSRVIAVVLTGRGNDAATGASAVHRFGGTVIVSSAGTSAHQSMPQAAIDRDDAVDHVVALESIAPLLIALSTSSAEPRN
jgi:two-component system chemotaxis response regulator CheB